MSNKPVFITGIGTDVGKTVVSAVLTEQLKADYWKPVQAGDLQHTDSQKVESLISNSATFIHPERFKFQLAASPHKASKEEGIKILLTDFELPDTKNRLLIEGAGGLFVPLSSKLLIIDLIEKFEAETVLVVRDYLGCINHTLLSIQALIHRKIALRHVVFNGSFDQDTYNILVHHLPLGCTYNSVPEFKELNKAAITSLPPIFEL